MLLTHISTIILASLAQGIGSTPGVMAENDQGSETVTYVLQNIDISLQVDTTTVMLLSNSDTQALFFNSLNFELCALQQAYLKNTSDGKIALLSYANRGELTHQQRNSVTHLVIARERDIAFEKSTIENKIENFR